MIYSGWKEQVETKVSVCSSLLWEHENLDGELRKGDSSEDN